MKTDVRIGNTQGFALQKAVLLYGQSHNTATFATVHDIRRPDNGDGPPYLGPAQLLSQEFVQDLVKSLGAAIPAEIFPDTVLCRNDAQTLWWTPAQTRVLFFHKESELAAIDARRFPIPPLVFRVFGGRLSVRALAEDRRPAADTPLFHAPFWNIYKDSHVCHGSMRAPQNNNLAALAAWEKAFFESNFTHTIHNVTGCAHPGGVAGLWRELADRGGPFPAAYLKEADMTLEEFVHVH